MKTLWDYIKSIYKNKFNIDEKVIDYIALNDIFSMSVNGFSNTTIARELEVDCRYIRDALISFLKFYGWENDLDISPMRVYDYCKGNYIRFCKEIKILSPILTRKEISIAYPICKEYEKIRKELLKYESEN